MGGQSHPYRCGPGDDAGPPGGIRWAGRRKGQDNAEVLGELGYSEEDIAELARRGVI